MSPSELDREIGLFMGKEAAYSADIAAAWRVADRIASYLPTAVFTKRSGWACQMSPGGVVLGNAEHTPILEFGYESAATAICLAAMKVKDQITAYENQNNN